MTDLPADIAALVTVDEDGRFQPHIILRGDGTCRVEHRNVAAEGIPATAAAIRAHMEDLDRRYPVLLGGDRYAEARRLRDETGLDVEYSCHGGFAVSVGVLCNVALPPDADAIRESAARLASNIWNNLPPFPSEDD